MSDPQTGEPLTGIDKIDSDTQIRQINSEIQELYFSYYEFDTHGVACRFHYEQEKRDKEKMLLLLAKLNARLAEINDGSFAVEDLETPRISAL